MCDHCGCDGEERPAHAPEPASRRRIVAVEQDVLAGHQAEARALRRRLAQHGAQVVNLIGSPGCGKTEMCIALIRELGDQVPVQVVVGDLATDNDARRIAATGAPVYQVETGTACHLTAHDIEHAVSHLPPAPGALILVENVGNLVCPSMFDLGESLRLVQLSVTEGTDKPEKYPVAFREADVAVLSKADLLPHVDFDPEECGRLIRAIKPGLPIVVASARTGAGMTALADHLRQLCVAPCTSADA